MRPLEGLLVVSLEQAVAAPTCSQKLADAGARVIKVERREGDFARGYDTAAAGLSSYFVWLNRGKESIALDIKDAADKSLLARLVARADVFIQNLAPGALARAGFGSAALRARHKRLITVDISGYGEEGDYARMKAYDLLVQAESGLASVTGHPAGPGRVGVSVVDIATGMNAHAAVLEALIARGITGRGTGIAVSLFDAMADWMNVPLLFLEGTGRAPERVGLAHPSICPYGAFATSDGALVLVSVQNEREWAGFCAGVLGNPACPRGRAGAATPNAWRTVPRWDAHIAAASRPARGEARPAGAGGHRLRLRERGGGAGAAPGAPAHQRGDARRTRHACRAAGPPVRRSARPGPRARPRGAYGGNQGRVRSLKRKSSPQIRTYA
jgi:crotonobetainyl-CoA:carnitine CoA-transferase CaiB-like acyl-CoA transferase